MNKLLSKPVIISLKHVFFFTLLVGILEGIDR